MTMISHQTFRIMELLFDYATYQRLVEEQGKILYGHRYKIHVIDEPPLHRMITYFIQDVEKARKERIHLGKGLMLTGPVGCGKTALMHIFTAMSGGEFAPHPVTTRHIALEYSRKGGEAIARYSDKGLDPLSGHPIVYCFDGLGMEADIQHFGPPCNVMQEILYARAEMTGKHRVITHATTQLDAAALEKRYGKNIRSRMRAMFNLIHFHPESPDKRR